MHYVCVCHTSYELINVTMIGLVAFSVVLILVCHSNISFCLNDVRHIFIFVILLPYVQLVQVFYRERKIANIN